MFPVCQHFESISRTYFKSWGRVLHCSPSHQAWPACILCHLVSGNVFPQWCSKGGRGSDGGRSKEFCRYTQEREGPRLKTACPPQAVSFYTHPSLMTSSPAHHRSKPWTMENCMPNTPAACVFTALLLENDEAV